MKERPGMCCAAGEIGQRQDPEHGCLQRLPERHRDERLFDRTERQGYEQRAQAAQGVVESPER